MQISSLAHQLICSLMSCEWCTLRNVNWESLFSSKENTVLQKSKVKNNNNTILSLAASKGIIHCPTTLMDLSLNVVLWSKEVITGSHFSMVIFSSLFFRHSIFILLVSGIIGYVSVDSSQRWRYLCPCQPFRLNRGLKEVSMWLL